MHVSGGDVSEISEATDDSIFSQVRHPSVTLVPPNNLFTSKRDQINVKILSPPNKYIAVEMNESQSLLSFASASPLPLKHPCEGFSFPPPPLDRKRTGPRRKFFKTLNGCYFSPMLMMSLTVLFLCLFSLSCLLHPR